MGRGNLPIPGPPGTSGRARSPLARPHDDWDDLSRMRGRWISRRTWVRHAVLLPAVLAASSSAAGARPPGSDPPGRHWGGTGIESLDPSPRAAVDTVPAGTGGSPAEQRLSDETTFTRWAHVA